MAQTQFGSQIWSRHRVKKQQETMMIMIQTKSFFFVKCGRRQQVGCVFVFVCEVWNSEWPFKKIKISEKNLIFVTVEDER